MANLLNKILNVLRPAQKTAIDSFVSEKSKSFFVTKRELLTQFQSLVSKTDSNGRFFDFAPAESDKIIKSSYINENFENIFLDLNTLYNGLTLLENKFNELNNNNTEQINKAKSALYKAIQQATIFKFLKSNPSYQDMKYVDFIDSSNESNFIPKAKIDLDTFTLELAPKSRLIAQNPNKNLNPTKVNITHSGGGKVVKSINFPPENMLDRVPNTLWAELIFSDSPILQKYVPCNGDGYELDIFGPIIYIDIDFNIAEPINNIKFLPYSKYPIKILDVCYKESRSESAWKPIKDFVSSTTAPVFGYFKLNFDLVIASQVRLVICQETYSYHTYHLPKSIVYNTDIFSHIYEAAYRKEIIDDYRTSADQTVIAVNPKASALIEALDDLDSDFKKITANYSNDPYQFVASTIDSIVESMSNLDPGAKSDLLEIFSLFTSDLKSNIIQIQKYQYNYGIRDIEVALDLYSPVSFYSSPKFQTTSAIYEAELETTEYHPLFKDEHGEFYKTSIEYEIELGENRTIDIVPLNYSGDADELIVRNEYLRFDKASKLATTRFKIQNTFVTVRENNVYLPASRYTFSGNASGYGQVYIPDLSRNSVYNITYNPVEQASSIDISSIYNSEQFLPYERFERTAANNRVELTAYPYVEYQFINSSDLFIRDDEDVPAYKWSSPILPYTSGTTYFRPRIVNSSGTVVFSGSTSITFTGADLTGHLSQSYLSGNYGYEIKFRDVANPIDIVTIVSATGATIESIPEISLDSALTFGSAYNSSNGIINSDYAINVTYTSDSQTFGMANPVYEPIIAIVNGKKATNRTNYSSLINPAFENLDSADNSYEYIHKGKYLLFNKPITGEILVYYRWVAKYIKINASLYNLEPAYNIVTPKVDEIKLYLRSSKL